MHLLCFGNPAVPDDRLGYDLSQLDISGVIVRYCSSPDDILSYTPENCLIVDVAKGISSPTLITDVSMLKAHPLVSMHDFDLSFFLQVSAELGHAYRVLALPMGMTLADAKRAIIPYLPTPRPRSGSNKKNTDRTRE